MKKIFFISIFLFTAIVMHAQKDLNFEFDYARFNYDTSSVFIEFYYDLNPKNMTIINTDKGFLIEAIVHIEMKNEANGTYSINKDWKLQSIIQSDSSAKTLTGSLGFVVPKGKYSFKIDARDSRNPSLTKSVTETIVIEPYSRSKYSISDIQLAQNIIKEGADTTSIFYKNTLEVIPNPDMIYTETSPVLFYYAELYNLILEKENANFTLQKMLYNSVGKMLNKTSKEIKQAANAVVDYGVINLSKYPTDSYLLRMTLTDPISKQVYTSEKRFYLHNPKVVDNTKTSKVSNEALGSEFALYNMEECDKMFSEANYLATTQEINNYKKLDSLKSKQEFLFNFWKGRDVTPETPLNEFKEEYLKRVDEANKNFSRMNKEGYLTDRGRVYILYGPPDQRDLYPNQTDKKPYEIWFYSGIEGGVYFYFGDLSGFGNYELLHSTKRDEVKDDYWERRITATMR